MAYDDLVKPLLKRADEATRLGWYIDPTPFAVALREQARELDERQDNLEFIQSRNEELVFERNRLASENAGLRKDAARYRWLCDGHTWEPEENQLTDKADMDAYIDAAMEPK